MGSIKGIVGGIILFIVAFPLLWWNEGRAVKTYKALKEGAQNAVHIEDISSVSADNEGKLIHISGKATTTDVLNDSQFGIQTVGIKLARSVEMYQWIEHSSTETKKKVGGSEEKTTTYTYDKGWSSSLISSAEFQEKGHDNPASIPFKEEESLASNVTIGAFKLTENQIKRIGRSTPLKIKEDQPLPTLPNVSRMDDGFYISKNGVSTISTPEIGDIKVSFSIIEPHDISIIAVQSGNTFKPYKASNDKTLDMLSEGIKSKDEMFEAAERANAFLTWILRLVGFFLMFAGISTVLAPLAVLADVLPFLGTLVRTGTKAISFLIALPFSLLTIALAWIFYRPLIGISLLVIVVVCVVLIIKKAHAAKAAAPAEAPAQG